MLLSTFLPRLLCLHLKTLPVRCLVYIPNRRLFYRIKFISNTLITSQINCIQIVHFFKLCRSIWSPQFTLVLCVVEVQALTVTNFRFIMVPIPNFIDSFLTRINWITSIEKMGSIQEKNKSCTILMISKTKNIPSLQVLKRKTPSR